MRCDGYFLMKTTGIGISSFFPRRPKLKTRWDWLATQRTTKGTVRVTPIARFGTKMAQSNGKTKLEGLEISNLA